MPMQEMAWRMGVLGRDARTASTSIRQKSSDEHAYKTRNADRHVTTLVAFDPEAGEFPEGVALDEAERGLLAMIRVQEDGSAGTPHVLAKSPALFGADGVVIDVHRGAGKVYVSRRGREPPRPRTERARLRPSVSSSDVRDPCSFSQTARPWRPASSRNRWAAVSAIHPLKIVPLPVLAQGNR